MNRFTIHEIHDITVFDSRNRKELFTFNTWCRSVDRSFPDGGFSLDQDKDVPHLQHEDLSLTEPFTTAGRHGHSGWKELWIPEDKARLEDFSCTQRRGNRGTILFLHGEMRCFSPILHLETASYESSEIDELSEIQELIGRLTDCHEDEPFETDYDEKRYLEDLIEIRRLAESAISHAKWRLAIKDDEALARIHDWDDRRRWC